MTNQCQGRWYQFGGPSRRSQSKRLVVEPVSNPTGVVGKEPEAKFKPGVDRAVEGQQGLKEIGAGEPGGKRH